MYFSGTLSCAEVAEKIDKSLSLTTKILNELVDGGYVVETGLAPSSGGRRAQMYSIKPGILYTVSVAMDQFVTRLAVMDMQNRYISKMLLVEIDLTNNPGAVEILIEKIQEVINASGVEIGKFLGIGISMPGFVDAKKGINYSFLEYNEGSLSVYIEDKIGIPVFIDNDSSVIALAELKFGLGKRKQNVMVINVGWGIGLGMILDRELFRGEDGFAGEFSHIPLFQNGKLCRCGKSGCLETETSLTAMIHKACDGLVGGRTSILKKQKLSIHAPQEAADAIIDAAGKGDRFSVELLSEAGYNIGRGIAILIHLLNPGLVVLSGRGASAGRILQVPIHQALNEHCIPSLAANTEVVVSALGHEAQLIGSAALVVEKFDKSITLKEKAAKPANKQPKLNRTLN